MKPEQVPTRLVDLSGLDSSLEFLGDDDCFRSFDKVTNDGCWVIGQTGYIEKYNTFLYLVDLDRTGDKYFRDPEQLGG